MKKYAKVFIGILVLLTVLAQLFPANDINGPIDPKMDLKGDAAVPLAVATALTTSCYDCHSNQPNYPWYSQIGIVKYYLTNHIKGSHKKLNFSTWNAYSADQKRHLKEEMCEEILGGEMPIKSYAMMHEEVALTEDQKNEICAWAKQN